MNPAQRLTQSIERITKQYEKNIDNLKTLHAVELAELNAKQAKQLEGLERNRNADIKDAVDTYQKEHIPSPLPLPTFAPKEGKPTERRTYKTVAERLEEQETPQRPAEKDDKGKEELESISSPSSSDDEEEEEEEQDFIVEDDDEERLESCYGSEEDDEKDIPPPVVSKVFKTYAGKRRTRSTRKRFEEDEDEDDEEGDDCLASDSGSSGEGGENNLDEDQWNTLKGKSYYTQKRSPWFKKRFLDAFTVMRNGLGNQGNNTISITVWDDIAKHPNWWTFEEVEKFHGLCALCNKKKPIYYKGSDEINKKDYFFSSCCGPLAQAWHRFHLVLAKGVDATLKELDEARGVVVEKNANKRRRRR